MTKLSEKKGGGLIYNPPRMLFDGSTGYYNKTQAVSGNEFRIVFLIKVDSQPGSGDFLIFQCAGTGGTRCSAYLGGASHADTAYRNRLRFAVQNTSGTNICRLYPDVDIADGQLHFIELAFNGTTPSASMKVDGRSAINASAPNHNPATAGTAVNAATNFVVGVSTLSCELGLVGYADAAPAAAGYSDQFGNPKRIDFSTWLFGHFAGKMDENEGTAGAMTKNGTITLADPGECPHIGLPTKGSASSAMIDAGATAWVDGVEIVGARAVPGSVILEYPFPTGQAGAYTRTLNDAAAKHSALTLASASPCTLDANGYLNADSGIGWGSILQGEGALPSNPGTRVYEMWGYLADVTPTTDYGVAIRFNQQDSSNYWAVYVTWTGTAWQVFLAEIIAGAFNLRGPALSLSTSIDWPCRYSLRVYDTGDRIYYAVDMYEVDDASAESRIVTYNAVSRSKKNETGFRFAFNNTTYQDVLVRGLRVYDLV